MSQFVKQSFKVSATLAAQRIVALTGTANTVGYPENNTARMPIGITMDTVQDTTQSIPVAGVGSIAKLYFNDTVSASGLVAADTSGRGVPFAAVTATSNTFVGILIGAAVASTGTIAEVYIQPGSERLK